MSRKLLAMAATAVLSSGAVWADVPRVAVDVAPIHSLVARVMQGVSTPSLIVAPGASPHEYNLRPSEAAALQEAQLVVWVGPVLTPWLEDAIGTIAGDATALNLLGADGTTELGMREDALFETHEHADHGEDHVDDDHDDHDEDHADDDHNEHGEDDAHAHDGPDPHAWLSPDNGAVWMDLIAAELSAIDPDNAPAYTANAAAGRTEIAAVKAEIEMILKPVRGGAFIVFHDAYQYFERAFEFPASGAISLSDAADPSPARIAEIRDRIAAQNVTCVLSEPQFNSGIVAAVTDGAPARVGVLDPLGSELEPGPELYPRLLRNLATSLAGCL